jgi:hypothetical protein
LRTSLASPAETAVASSTGACAARAASCAAARFAFFSVLTTTTGAERSTLAANRVVSVSGAVTDSSETGAAGLRVVATRTGVAPPFPSAVLVAVRFAAESPGEAEHPVARATTARALTTARAGRAQRTVLSRCTQNVYRIKRRRSSSSRFTPLVTWRVLNG